MGERMIQLLKHREKNKTKTEHMQNTKRKTKTQTGHHTQETNARKPKQINTSHKTATRQTGAPAGPSARIPVWPRPGHRQGYRQRQLRTVSTTTICAGDCAFLMVPFSVYPSFAFGKGLPRSATPGCRIAWRTSAAPPRHAWAKISRPARLNACSMPAQRFRNGLWPECAVLDKVPASERADALA